MKNYTLELLDTRDEWLNKRCIGGSDACAIVGLSTWETTNDIYNRVVCHKEKSKKQNELMICGTKAEKPIAELFAISHRKKYEVESVQEGKIWLYKRIDYPELTLTPDRLLIDKETNKKGGLEIKRVELIKKEDKEQWEKNIVPNQYYFQLLHYFIVKDDIEFMILCPLLDFYEYNKETKQVEYIKSEIKELYIDKQDVLEHINYLFNMEKDFVENNIRKQKRPTIII